MHIHDMCLEADYNQRRISRPNTVTSLNKQFIIILCISAIFFIKFTAWYNSYALDSGQKYQGCIKA